MSFEMKFDPDSDHSVTLSSEPTIRHGFLPREIRAIQAALTAERPLLVQGEPGVGKSQLAKAAAIALNYKFVQHVVDARTESRDLLWHFDAISRLATAQVMGALQMGVASTDTLRSSGKQALALLKKELAIPRFIHPGPLWWAFDWKSAEEQAARVGAPRPPQRQNVDSGNGCVVLIDEIDKAEPDLPNGLLEALGAGEFTPIGLGHPVRATQPPLVIITTNGERTLPDAFLRRCLVLHLALPREPQKLKERLIERGRLHFPEAGDPLLDKAAGLLITDRVTAQESRWRPLPGQAEYLDLVRSVVGVAGHDQDQQMKLIEWNAEFVLRKHPDAMPEPDSCDD